MPEGRAADRERARGGDQERPAADCIAYHVRHPTSPTWTWSYRTAYYEATGVPLRDAAPEGGDRGEDQITAFAPRLDATARHEPGSLLAQAAWVARREGLARAAWRTAGWLHEHYLRPRLPERDQPTRLNGVLAPVEGPRLGDRWLGLPNYEGPLIRGVKTAVTAGDRVLVVGAGRGVSTVHAARQAQPGGRVHAYEASRQRVRQARRTLHLNPAAGRAATTLAHAVVGVPADAASTDGPVGDAAELDAGDLPAADVLVLDCEGGERAVLAGLQPPRPRSVVVETHGHLGSPPAVVESLLASHGYRLETRERMQTPGVEILVADRDPDSAASQPGRQPQASQGGDR